MLLSVRRSRGLPVALHQASEPYAPRRPLFDTALPGAGLRTSSAPVTSGDPNPITLMNPQAPSRASGRYPVRRDPHRLGKLGVLHVLLRRSHGSWKNWGYPRSKVGPARCRPRHTVSRPS